MPRTNPVSFFGEVKSELTKVSWPGKDQVVRLTAVVIIISLIVGIFVGLLDFSFTKIVEFLVKK